jgi:hypothetical protein
VSGVFGRKKIKIPRTVVVLSHCPESRGFHRRGQQTREEKHVTNSVWSRNNQEN